MVVEPEQRGRHLRQLVGVEDRLGLARTEPIRRHCGVAVAVRRHEAAMEVSHEPHRVAERRQPRVDRDPGRVRGREIVRVAHRERSAALGNDCHPERAELAGQPGAVVVRPHRGRRQLRMKLPADLGLGERVRVRSTRRGDDDPSPGDRHGLEVLRQLAALRGARNRDSARPRHRQGGTGSQAVLQKATARDPFHVSPLESAVRHEYPKCSTLVKVSRAISIARR